MIVRFLMIAEIEVVQADAATEEAQERLDGFRESVRPSAEHGIVLYRVRSDDLTEDLVRDGLDFNDSLSREARRMIRGEQRGIFKEPFDD